MLKEMEEMISNNDSTNDEQREIYETVDKTFNCIFQKMSKH